MIWPQGRTSPTRRATALPAGEPATDESYLLDNTAPVLTAFARNTPATSPTNADTLVFDITFDEDVSIVTPMTSRSAGRRRGRAGRFGQCLHVDRLRRRPGGFEWHGGLDLAAGQNITDAVGNALPAGEPATDESYLVDNTAPVLTAFARNTPADQSHQRRHLDLRHHLQ